MQALKNYFCPGTETRSPNKNDDSFSNFLLREFAYYKFVGLDLFDEISIRTNLEISPIQNEEKSTIDERKALFKFFEKLTVSKSFKPSV